MTTIPKIKIFESFCEESRKLPITDALYEWFSNTTYSNSKNSLVDIHNVNDTMEVLYCCDQSNPEIDLNKMISFKSSHNINGEIGHHGDGFKRFSFKHLGNMEVFSIYEDTFDYISQDQIGLINLINNGIGNPEFERRMDTSEFTIFKQNKELEDLPSKIKKYIEQTDLPFIPKFIVLFKKLETNIGEYTNYSDFDSLLNCIKFINYKHLDNIYIRNQFLKKYIEFSEIVGLDIKGEENYDYELKFSLYKNLGEINGDTVYYLKYNNIGFVLSIGNRNKYVREIVDVDCFKTLDYLADITLREVKESINQQLRDLIKYFKKNKIITPSHLLEKYAGIYLIFNGIPINYISSNNDWLPKSGNLPGRSRYRCIVEPKSEKFMNKLIHTEGIKSNSKLSLEMKWDYIIKSNINTILETYRKFYRDTLPNNNVLTEEIITGNIQFDNPIKEEGFHFIIKLGNNNYYYDSLRGKSLNINTIIKKIKSNRKDLQCSNTSHIIYNRFFTQIDQSIPILDETLQNFQGIEINEEFRGHFYCNSIETLFLLQKTIYQNLSSSNVYN